MLYNILMSLTDKRKYNGFKETAVTGKVLVSVVANFAREMTKEIDRTREYVSTDATEAETSDLVVMTTDELEMTLVASAKLVHVV